MSLPLDPERSELPKRPHLREVDIIHNPALGAFLLWRVGEEYQGSGELLPMPVAFLVLPMLLHRKTLNAINSTNKASDLPLFAAKLGEHQDDLLGIHARALVLRDLSLRSLTAGSRAQLLTVNYDKAIVRSADVGKTPAVPERIKPLVRGAERLGAWFSRLGVGQIATILRVDF